MEEKVTITSIDFKNYKALKNYSVRLQHMNIFVGPNNSGKSTLISAFRILDIGIRQALFKKASIVKGPNYDVFGYVLPEELLPTSLENVHTDYADVDTTITFRLSNGNKLILFFPLDGGCNLLSETNGHRVSTPKHFKQEFPISLRIVPVLGPIEQNEQIVTEDTVKKGLNTHRASRHFRNYWNYYPEGFDEFAELVRKTWPGMTIKLPNKPSVISNELTMFCYENRIARELYWSGFGFQIWCQLLTHISRSKDASILVVDEPEVYLHPDVQRQLLGILRDCGPDIIMATHSAEIMGEADASEILLVNKRKKSSERLKDVDGIQKALDSIGSIHNVTLTHLARTGRLLFVEGEFDYKILRKFAKQLGLNELASGNDITPLKSEGFSYWNRIQAFTWGFKTTLNSEIYIGAIFDRDYWCDEELENILDELKQHLSLAHIHLRKEIENYLLIPYILDKALKRAIMEREKRLGIDIPFNETINSMLERITQNLKIETQARYITKRAEYLKSHNKEDSITINTETMQKFESKWVDLNSRMEIVPGKKVLRILRAEVQSKYSVNLTDFKIIDEFNKEDIPEEMQELLFNLEKFRKNDVG